MADTNKIILLKEWGPTCERVRKGLERLGHDIPIVPGDRRPDKGKRGRKGKGQG